MVGRLFSLEIVSFQVTCQFWGVVFRFAISYPFNINSKGREDGLFGFFLDLPRVCKKNVCNKMSFNGF